MQNVKQELLDRFTSEEACGIYYADFDDNGEIIRMKDVPEDDRENSAKYEFFAYLPTGLQMGKCTNCANWIKDLYGDRAEVYGFASKDNPKCTHNGVLACFGHDFPLVDNRYIVDIWISHYSGAENQYVFDLQDRNDFAKITEIYGDPKKWSILKENGFVSPYSSEYPKDKRVSLGQPRNGELSI